MVQERLYQIREINCYEEIISVTTIIYFVNTNSILLIHARARPARPAGGGGLVHLPGFHPGGGDVRPQGGGRGPGALDDGDVTPGSGRGGQRRWGLMRD